MSRIYIIGPIGSGKTTFSKKLSLKYNIERYELDNISWDDENGHIKRIDEEVTKRGKILVMESVNNGL